MSAKTWKPRVHTERLTQRTQRRVHARASDVAADARAEAPLSAGYQRILDKFTRLHDVYGESWPARLETEIDRLLAGGVQ